MRWQNPWAWLGLAMLALPVLVHLFSRRPARVAAFPSLRFIDVSRLLPTRRLQLSDVPLLLVRMAIVAMAVAGLAQPLWRGTVGAETGRKVAIVGERNSDDGIVGDQRIGETVKGGADTLVVRGVAREVLGGAVAWLGVGVGAKELVVLSDFRAGALDSLDIAAVPADVTVRLVRVPRDADTTRDSLPVGWVVWSGRAGAAHDAVRAAVRQTVGSADSLRVVDAVPMTGGASSDASHARVMMVASPSADSLAVWRAGATAPATAWMGDAMVALTRDSTLVTVSAALTVADTVLRAPFVVLVRTANNAPVVAAASIVGSNGAPRLLLWSRAPETSLATAALLLAATRAMSPVPSPTVSPSLSTSMSTSMSPSLSTAASSPMGPDDARLQAWATAHNAARGQALAALPVREATSSDATTGPSDGRVLWMLVLVLLGVETYMRRRGARASKVTMADAA